MQHNGRDAWHPGNKKEVLCQWVAALCMFVADFNPEPLKFDEDESPIFVHGLIIDLLVPKAKLSLQEPLRITDKPQHVQDEPHTMPAEHAQAGGSIMSSSSQPQASSSTSQPPTMEPPTADILQALFAQMHTQSSINTHILESLQELKAALPAAQKKKEKVQPTQA